MHMGYRQRSKPNTPEIHYKLKVALHLPHVPRILRRMGRGRHAEPRTIQLVRRPHVHGAQQRSRIKEILEKRPCEVRLKIRLVDKLSPVVGVYDINCQADDADADGGQDESDQGDHNGLKSDRSANTFPLR